MNPQPLDHWRRKSECDRLSGAPRGISCIVSFTRVTRRPVAARREAFTLASFDRLRVLTTELKRLIAAGGPVALRLGVGPALENPRLASALWWL